jgi:hypothetical protein
VDKSTFLSGIKIAYPNMPIYFLPQTLEAACINKIISAFLFYSLRPKFA